MNQVRGFRLLALTGIVGFGFVAGVLHAAPDKKPVEKKADAPKYTVEEVMAKIHKGKEKSVFAVILNNKGTADDKAKLVDYYTALAASEAPKGDKVDWSKRTAAMLTAAKEVQTKADTKSLGALKTSADCKSCHKVYKD